MSVQLVSEKKLRQAASMTGLPLIRVLRHSNRHWFGFVRRGEGHWHVAINPVTWEWTTKTESAFSSCETYGPHVDPPEGLRLLAQKAGRFEDEFDRAERVTTALRFYASSEYDDEGEIARAALAAERRTDD